MNGIHSKDVNVSRIGSSLSFIDETTTTIDNKTYSIENKDKSIWNKKVKISLNVLDEVEKIDYANGEIIFKEKDDMRTNVLVTGEYVLTSEILSITSLNIDRNRELKEFSSLGVKEKTFLPLGKTITIKIEDYNITDQYMLDNFENKEEVFIKINYGSYTQNFYGYIDNLADTIDPNDMGKRSLSLKI